MSISSLGPTTLVRRSVVARAAGVPQAAPAPAKQPARAPEPSFSLGGMLKDLGHKVADFVATPYRALAGKIGADRFVRPGQGTAEGKDPSNWGLKFETLNFKSQDGTPLKGWYMPADKPTDKTIVLSHGHGGQMSDVLWRWAPWLHKAGYNLMAFDFRNSGGSGGTKTTMGFEERWDLSAALDQVQAKGAKHIAVMGLSMGAATALSQAAVDPRIETVVSDCSFDTIEHAVASRVAKNTFDIPGFTFGPIKFDGIKGLHFPWKSQATQGTVEASEKLTGHTESSPGGSLRSAEPARAMAKLQNKPVFLIHGGADDETLPSNSENLAKADPNAQLWIVPGAGHGGSYQTAKEEYKAKVLDFLAKSF